MRYILLLFVFVLGLFSLGITIDDTIDACNEVEQHVNLFHFDSPDRVRKQALKYVAFVVHWSEEYQIDPLLTATVIDMESSWIPNRPGKLGEIGLMQVHYSGFKKGFDLSKPTEQIHAGVKALRYCFDHCGQELNRGLTGYATGKCRNSYPGLRLRLKNYRKTLRVHRVKEKADPIINEIDNILREMR